jgi:hypothetical protein
MADWDVEAEMLQWAGVSFGERDTLLLKNAIKVSQNKIL